MGRKKGTKDFGEAIIEEVLKLKSEGKSNRQISEHYGFSGPEIIKQLVKRYNRKQRKIAAGIIPRKTGRPLKIELVTEENKDYVIKQLKMENDLLRSFLSDIGRR